MKRAVRLLDRTDSRQRRAQRKYRRTPAARAAQARHWAAWYARPENRAKAIARATASNATVQRRVYKRIWKATKKRLLAQVAQ